MKLLPRIEPPSDAMFLHVVADGLTEPSATRLHDIARRFEKLERDRSSAIAACDTWKRRVLRYARHDGECTARLCRCGLAVLLDELIDKYLEERDESA